MRGGNDFDFDSIGAQWKTVSTKDGPLRINPDFGKVSLRADGLAIDLHGIARDPKRDALVDRNLQAAIQDRATGKTRLLTVNLGTTQRPLLEIYYGSASSLRADEVLREPSHINSLTDDIYQLDIERLEPASPEAAFITSVIDRLNDPQVAQALVGAKTVWKPEEITKLKQLLRQNQQTTKESAEELPSTDEAIKKTGDNLDANLDAMDARIKAENDRRDALAKATPENITRIRRELSELGIIFADAADLSQAERVSNFTTEAGSKLYAVIDLNDPKLHKWLAKRIDSTSDFWLFNSKFGEKNNAFARNVRDAFRLYVTDRRDGEQSTELRPVNQIYLNKDAQGSATHSIKELNLEVRSEAERNTSFVPANRRVILIIDNPNAPRPSQ